MTRPPLPSICPVHPPQYPVSINLPLQASDRLPSSSPFQENCFNWKCRLKNSNFQFSLTHACSYKNPVHNNGLQEILLRNLSRLGYFILDTWKMEGETTIRRRKVTQLKGKLQSSKVCRRIVSEASCSSCSMVSALRKPLSGSQTNNKRRVSIFNDTN